MTKEEKKARRQLRHELQQRVTICHFSKNVLLTSTPAQISAWAKKVTDQLFAGKNPREASCLNS